MHVVVESCTICGSRSGWPVRKLLDSLSYNYALIAKAAAVCTTL